MRPDPPWCWGLLGALFWHPVPCPSFLLLSLSFIHPMHSSDQKLPSENVSETWGLMELELRKWLPNFLSNKIVYSFPKHSQSVVCLCVCKSEGTQELSPGANLRLCWGSLGVTGNRNSRGLGCSQS